MAITVGLRVQGKADRIVVDAEDALVAALKVKAERPEVAIMYVRRLNRRGDTAPASHSNWRPLTGQPPAGKEAQLTYIVNESCIRCKYMDCVEVCPVDCFYEGENMLVSIHPDECIDCGVCEPECPVAQSNRTRSPVSKSGSRSMRNMLRSGRTSP